MNQGYKSWDKPMKNKYQTNQQSVLSTNSTKPTILRADCAQRKRRNDFRIWPEKFDGYTRIERDLMRAIGLHNQSAESGSRLYGLVNFNIRARALAISVIEY